MLLTFERPPSSFWLPQIFNSHNQFPALNSPRWKSPKWFYAFLTGCDLANNSRVIAALGH